MKRIICLLLAMAMALSLCACGSRTSRPVSSRTERGDSDMENAGSAEDSSAAEVVESTGSEVLIPEWVYDRKESLSTSVKDSKVGVNFYYDNTISMYPFVCDVSGNSGNAVEGSLVGVIKSVRELMQQDSESRSYTLQLTGKDNTLHWAEFSGEIHDHFGTKDFYTFTGNFPRPNGVYQGPLFQLYYNSGLDENDVNIVLTDLAEQGVNNTALASAINNNILIEDGSAAGMIAFMCDYNGKAIVPKPLNVSETMGGNVNGRRPLYLIITGPERETKRAFETLCDALQQYLTEGEDYFTVYQEVGATIVRAEDDAVVQAPVFSEMKDRHFNKKLVSEMQFNDTYGMFALDKQELKNLFPGNLSNDGYVDVPVSAYRAAAKKEANSTRKVLNYYIPMQGFDPDTYAYRVATSFEDERTSDSMVDEVLEQKDYMKYSFLSNAGTEKEPDYSWIEGNKSDFDALFDLKTELISGEVLEGAIQPESSRGGVILAESDQIDLTSCDTWLKVSVEAKTETFPGKTIIFDIPVYANTTTREIKPLPAWVGDFNVDASASQADCLTHTFNLSGFVSTLFALNTNESDELYQAEREVKIADVVTVLTDLKVGR